MEMEILKAPFLKTELEWRIQRSGLKGDGTPYAAIVPYVDARAIMERLDNAVGPGNWATRYEHANGGVLCALSIKIGDEWVAKTDGAEVPVEKDTSGQHIDPVKTSLTNAFKRAAVQWGIARELYGMEAFAVFSSKGKYQAKIKNQSFRWDPPGEKPPSGASAPPGDRGAGKESPSTNPNLRKQVWDMLLELESGDSKAAGAELGRLTQEIGGKTERFWNKVDQAIVAELHEKVRERYEREMR